MIRTHVDGPIATVTLDRPDKKNALTLAMRQELEALPSTLGADPSVRVVVLTGAGGCFSAGADLREIADLGPGMTPSDPAEGLRSLGTPTIAAAEGVCVTGGLEIALSCDIVLAADTARFADTHAKMNALPRWGQTAVLPRRVGRARAIELLLSSRWVDAEEAARIGLVNRVVPAADLAEEVRLLAASIAAVDSAIATATIDLVDHGLGVDLAEAVRHEKEISVQHGTDDLTNHLDER